MPIPVRIPVRPTLRGLIERVEKSRNVSRLHEPRVFDWQSVVPKGDIWTVRDEEGKPLRHDGRRVWLCLCDTRIARVARRARKRALRRALEHGGLNLVERFRSPLPARMTLLTIGIGGSLALIGLQLWIVLRSSHSWSTIPANVQFAAAFTVFLMTLMYLAFGVVLSRLAIVGTRCNVRSIRFTSDDVTGERTDGTSFSSRWNDVIDLCKRGSNQWELGFADGETLHLHEPARASSLLMIVRDTMIDPEGVLARRQNAKRTHTRAGILWIVGCLAIPAIVLSLIPPSLLPVSARYMWLYGITYAVLLPLCAACVWIGRRFIRRHRLFRKMF